MSTATTSGLTITPFFTKDTQHLRPYDLVEWEQRDARITDKKGQIIFEQTQVEFPSFWSQQATNIVASKYFRGALNTPEREYSVKQMIDRVVDTIAKWGQEEGYFATHEDYWTFHEELVYIILNQHAIFNSPVWFNIGIPTNKQVASACYILAVEDNMESILNWFTEEGKIFQWGSGCGINLSTLRAKNEHISGGGKSSGPLSFDMVADRIGGTIKSAGKTRRAARLIVLNADHPDIEEFIWCKVKEEEKAEALIHSGYDSSMDGEAYTTVAYQNANHSVSATHGFMHAAKNDLTWETRFVTNGKVHKVYKAQELLRQIAQAAHRCADPGLQFIDTINEWHTVPNSGPITSSNPCLKNDTKLLTDEGWFTVESLSYVEDSNIQIFDGKNFVPGRVWRTGLKKIIKLHIQDKYGFETTLECTPDHQILVKEKNSEKEFTYWKEALNTNGCYLPNFSSPHREYQVVKIEEVDGLYDVYDFSVKSDQHCGIANGLIVHNCSEFVHLNNTACNLAGLNLISFLNKDGSFDIAAFKHTVDIMITAQEILVGKAEYPTEKITQNSHDYRPLGIGYNNLGGLLMVKGMPYDSDAARDYAASITALMTGEAYAQSARLAQVKGAFAGFEKNKEPMLNVIQKHMSHVPEENKVNDGIWNYAMSSWVEAQVLGKLHGFRNAQVSLLQPGGTTALVMDCATTGIEPETALVKYKKLAGGGTLKMINPLVRQALQNLGYNQKTMNENIEYVEKHGSFDGISDMWLKKEHRSIFDCAFPVGEHGRSIPWQAHIKMVAAIQPFLSGAISKTTNLPHDATVEDIEKAYMMAYELGCKAISVYRDGSKSTQPLTTQQTNDDNTVNKGISLNSAMITHVSHNGVHMNGASSTAPSETLLLNASHPQPMRHKLPDERPSLTHKFTVGGHEGYITVGLFSDGKPGEIWLTMAKEGSTISGLMDAFATSISLALQYGVPLQALVDKFSHSRFEPSGFTQNRTIPIASSILDYIFRWLGQKFLAGQEGVETPVVHESHVAVPIADISVSRQFSLDAPLCSYCGTPCQRNGTCFLCPQCGISTGCA